MPQPKRSAETLIANPDPSLENGPDEHVARHLRMCRELAEIGMALAGSTARHALRDLAAYRALVAPDARTRAAHARSSAAWALCIDGLNRSVRQTLALEKRIAARGQTADRAGRTATPMARAITRQTLQTTAHTATRTVKSHDRIGEHPGHEAVAPPSQDIEITELLLKLRDDAGITTDCTSLEELIARARSCVTVQTNTARAAMFPQTMPSRLGGTPPKHRPN